MKKRRPNSQSLIFLAQGLDSLMRRIDVEMRVRVKKLDIERVGPNATIALTHIGFKDKMTNSDLAQKLIRDKSQVAKVLRTLEEHKLIEREIDITDTRSRLIELTPKGKSFHSEIESTLTEVLSNILSGLTLEEIELLMKILVKLD